MTLRFRCTGCGKMLDAPFMKVGDTVRCGECREEMKIPQDAVDVIEQEVRHDGTTSLTAEQLQASESVALAGRGHRFGAWFIDKLAFVIPLVLISPVRNDETLYFMAFAGIAIVYIAVQWVLLTTEGQTVGKMIMEIKIVEKETGKNGGFMTNVILRNVVNFIISWIPLYGLIDVLFIFKEDRRCLHDLIAGTKVVRAK
jgi:uncharacterized RDD family membrane protein YckC